ncbi:unnamed protein product [Schistosoma margrebowiei]|uniref:Uncharacterized protein n=1 Tax=Schistosoma margrebowiei TaxID=48269 RepID=A0A183MVL4_9TREM|nr:unnamed protein product [Schistosoma margrebowiei]
MIGNKQLENMPIAEIRKIVRDENIESNSQPLSLTVNHNPNSSHSFDWKNVEILDRGDSKNTRQFLEAWHSVQLELNKHIETNPIYQPIRKIMHKHNNKNQNNGRHNQNKEVNNNKFKVNKNQSTSRCTEQALKHIWRNSNTSLLSEVCADDVVQKNDESSTTKASNSENKTLPKDNSRKIGR